MPLFMDVHDKVDGLTADAVAGAHARDLEVQDATGSATSGTGSTRPPAGCSASSRRLTPKPQPRCTVRPTGWSPTRSPRCRRASERRDAGHCGRGRRLGRARPSPAVTLSSTGSCSRRSTSSRRRCAHRAPRRRSRHRQDPARRGVPRPGPRRAAHSSAIGVCTPAEGGGLPVRARRRGAARPRAPARRASRRLRPRLAPPRPRPRRRGRPTTARAAARPRSRKTHLFEALLGLLHGAGGTARGS